VAVHTRVQDTRFYGSCTVPGKDDQINCLGLYSYVLTTWLNSYIDDVIINKNSVHTWWIDTTTGTIMCQTLWSG